MRVKVLDEIYSQRLTYYSPKDDKRVSYGHIIDTVNTYESIINLIHYCEHLGYIHPYRNIVRCEYCKKTFNISPKRLIFMSKIARFNNNES